MCFWNLFPGESLIVHENNGKQVEVEVGMSEKRLIFIGNREILSNSAGSCWVLLGPAGSCWVLAGSWWVLAGSWWVLLGTAGSLVGPWWVLLGTAFSTYPM